MRGANKAIATSIIALNDLNDLNNDLNDLNNDLNDLF